MVDLRLMLLFLAVHSTILATDGEDVPYPKVTKIEPRDGSYEGATRVTLHGEGFSSSANLKPGQTNLGNVVYFKSDRGDTVPCDVEKDATSETRIICYTRPMRSGDIYYVQLVVDGNEVPFKENCRNNPRSWWCRFYPRWWLTPLLRSCTVELMHGNEAPQSSHAPGGLITCSGRIFTETYGSNNQTNENGRTVSFRRVYVGGMTCDLLREPDVFYDLQLTNGDEGRFTCKTKGTFVGYQDVSIILTDNYGRSNIEPSAVYVSANDELYTFQTYAEITNVTPQIGSSEGGTRVKIEGRNFDDTTKPAEILIGGVPCAVVEGTLTQTSLECIAGKPAEEKEYYIGSRGVIMEMWNETSFHNEEVLGLQTNASDYQGAVWIESPTFYWKLELDYFVVKISGVLVAPHTDRYKVAIQSDDDGSLFMNCDGSRENLTKVAYARHATSNYYRFDEQFTDWMYLTEGQQCYFEATLREWTWRADIHVGLLRATTSLTTSQSNEVKREIQVVDFSAEHRREKQNINFTNWDPQEGTEEVQTLTVRHSCIGGSLCDTVGYRLVFGGIKTLFIPADASASQVEKELKKISALSDAGISVTSTAGAGAGAGARAYSIAFGDMKGDYPTLDYEKHATNDAGLSVEIAEDTKGVSERKSFKLIFAGRTTESIREGADENDIVNALDATRAAYCPTFLLPDDRSSSVVTTLNYETDRSGSVWERGERKQDVEPFCGYTSIRNCDYVYYAGRTANDLNMGHKVFDAATFKYMCLAHRGLFDQQVWLTGTFRGGDAQVIGGTHTFAHGLHMEETQWRYSCMDLLAVINSRSDFAHVDEVEISVIKFARSGPDNDYYFDAITIGSSKVTEDLEGVLTLRTPPALANGEPISDITVQRTAGQQSFDIEVDTYNCGHLIPLITLAYTSESTRTTETVTQREAGWSASTSFVATELRSGVEPMSGHFDLTVHLTEEVSHRVSDIPVDISEDRFADLLESSVPGFGQGNVKRRGSCHAVDYEVEWVSNGGDKPQMEVHMDDVEGASDIMVEVNTKQDGGVFHDPVPGDMLRLVYDDPQVEVFINGIPSKCVGDCAFITSDEQTPTVSGISPTTGSSHLSTSITISGTNLNSLPDFSSTVAIGDTDCAVTSATATQISCVLGDGPLGTYQLMVNVGGKGYPKVEDGVPLEFTISGGVLAVEPATGFSSGGTLVTVTGYGFTKSTSFTIGDEACDVKTVSPTSATCITPASSLGATTTTITVNEGTTLLGSLTYTYTAPDAIVTSISPTSSTVNGGGNLTISGTGLGGSEDDVDIFLGTVHKCEMLQWSTTQIICKLPSAPPGQYALNVHADSKGYADTSTHSIPNIAYTLKVSDVSPTTSSWLGGTKVTISGEGFTDEESTEIKIGDAECDIDSISSTSIECTLGDLTTDHVVTNNGTHPTKGEGFAWEPTLLEVRTGDTVTWRWNIAGTPDTSLGARVFTTESATSDEYDEITFQSSTDKTQSGSYSYRFGEAGKYFISSGKVDDDVWGEITMRGVINVLPEVSTSNALSLMVGEHGAIYEEGRRRRDATCGGTVSSVPGCTPTLSPAAFQIVADSCYTPTITSISPTEGTMADTLIIRGTGFGTETCANDVIIASGFDDEYTCDVTSSSATTIKCKPNPLPRTRINFAFYVKVVVDSMGAARPSIQLDADRRFTLLPSATTITPKSGSLGGGTLINVTGSGFPSSASEVTVTLGGYNCEVQATNYYFIECLTPAASSESTEDAVVTVGGQTAECTGNCQFNYRQNLTPTVTAMTPSEVSTPDTEIAFEGTNFAGDESKVKVMFGDHECPVESSTSTTIRCRISGLPGGSHRVQIKIDGKGSATFDGAPTLMQSPSRVTSMSPTTGSRSGGTVLRFTGNGFATEDLRVMIANSDCPIREESLSNFEFECITPAKSSTKTVTVTGNGMPFSSSETLRFAYSSSQTPTLTGISPTTGEEGDTVTIEGTRLDPDNMTILIGEAECTDVSGSDTSVTCSLGDHAGGEVPVSATIVNLGFADSDLSFNYTFDVTGVTPDKGSFGGGDLLTVTGKGFGENTAIHVCESICEHGDDIEGTSAERTQIVCLVSADTSESFSDDRLCDVTASVDGASAVGEDLYTFSADRTPVVTAVSPSRGGTQGGTEIVITGNRFDTDKTRVSVSIGEVPCTISSSSETEIRCTTEARGKSIKALVEVTVSGKGRAANNDVEYYYVDVWSSRWTWGGNDPPVEGDFVVVPADQSLLIDVDTPVLKMLLIQGGKVMFDEKDIHLQAENILITDGGLFQIGTEEEPFQHKAIITLHGHLRSRELPIYGTKTIGVRNGTLDLHGKPIPTPWTLLSSTAAAGSNILQLKHAVTWSVGDELVVATTGHRHSQRETETAFISAISGDGRTLTLDRSLNYTHISVTQEYEGVTVETHAEVGLLTRNIVIKGSKHLEWSRDKIPACDAGFDTGEFKSQTCFQGRFGEEEGSDQFGGQIMIHHRAPDLNIARARIEYVELTNVGQAFRLGRYPIHFHLLGDVNFENYVRGCAIHKSFNRAVTIHNTHHLLVERNVIYDVMGGAVFIEDGIEHGNHISENLVVFCKQSTSLQNDDITPAAFWVTNPNNTIINNHAAGGTHFGFWYRIHEHPDGPSADDNICQQLHPVEKFKNNTVHSQGWFGLWVFEVYTPRGDGSCGSTTPTVVEFDSLAAWNCEKGAELVDVGSVRLRDFTMIHNSVAGIETKLIVDSQVKWGQAGTFNSSIIAHSPGLTEGGSTATGMILPFSSGYQISGTKFFNFDESGTSAIGVTSIDGHCSVLCGGWEARFSNIWYHNSPNKGRFRWEHESILRDLDGTLTGTGKNSIVMPSNPTISKDDCPLLSGFDVGEPKGVVCDGSAKFHRIALNNPSPTSLEGKQLVFINGEGESATPFLKKRLTHKFGWMATLKSGETYRVVFEGADHITNISYTAAVYDLMVDECVIISHNLTQKPDKVIVTADSEEAEQDRMVTCADNYHGDYFFDPNTKDLFYVVSGRDRHSRRRRGFNSNSPTEGAINRAINFMVYRCYYEKCIPPPNPNDVPPVRKRPDVFQKWHDGNTWMINDADEHQSTTSDVGAVTFPPDDVDIRIGPDTWVVIDKEFPRIGKLWIEGVLEVEGGDENLSFTLRATHIIILGGRLIVGWEDNSFKGRMDIILVGDIDTPDLLLDGATNLGAKAIGVIGGLDLHGFNRDLTKTHLFSTLAAGGNKITVEDSPSGWVAGDVIAIATTSADPWETETFSITEVDGNTLTLNSTARYEHIAEVFSFTAANGDDVSYDIRAEVALITRNIRIIGEDTGDIYEYSFGARLLIAGAGDARGYARIENVEFYHTGQEGFIDNYDPRYSVAFLNTGQVDGVKPSYVRRNSFHHGFNTAIGVFGATGLQIEDNNIHHTVGPAIRVEDSVSIAVVGNLVMLVRTRTVYQDRMENDLLLWKAGIEVHLSTSPTLSDNVVAGSERAGYRIDGHDCDPMSDTAITEGGYNIARATVDGVWLNKDGFPVCTRISNFRVHNAYDYGIYYQGSGSVEISDVLVTDTSFGILAIVYSPASVSHVYRDKYVLIEDSVVVAVSRPNYCHTLDSSTPYLMNSMNARATSRTGVDQLSRTAILAPAFISSHNSAPSKPFVGSMSYPAIGGKTTVRGVTFVNFDDQTCSSTHTVFMTNQKIEDFLHPIYTERLQFVNSAKPTYIFLHRPSIGKINPSDCVDMECDGMKKFLMVDVDGTMLGKTGTVIPQAEFEYDGDPRRGLGDYRIPRTFLTRLNGSRIPVNEVAPKKGISRENTTSTSCDYNNVWQAYECHGYHHGILVIESLDADTETRRLSPVALISNGYVDLNNGPQDHGWCHGYTCQERLSTFWTIVAFNSSYEMHFSGTAPAKLRLRILNEEPSTKMVIKIFYTRPQRLDVYVDNAYVKPNNHQPNADGQSVLIPPTYPGQFIPAMNTDVGSNYFDRDAQLLYIVLSGKTPVDIREAPVVVIALNMPAVTPDEFFDNGELVANLAAFLGIPSSKIRIVEAVREGSARRRRRRQTEGGWSVVFEIGDPPEQTLAVEPEPTNETTTAPPTTTPPAGNGTTPEPEITLNVEALNQISATIANAFMEDSLGDALGAEVEGLAMSDPREPAVRNPNNTNSNDSEIDEPVQYARPTGLVLTQQPKTGNALSSFVPEIEVAGIDASGEYIPMGHKGDPWEATATIVQGPDGAELIANVAKFVDTAALFEDLTATVAGTYVLNIAVTKPTGQKHLNVTTESFELDEPITTTAPPVTTPTPPTEECIECPDMWNVTSQEEEARIWICYVKLWRCNMYNWMKDFENWREMSCDANDGILVYDPVCPDQKIFGCCSGTQKCENLRGCEICYCSGGMFKDWRKINAFWLKESQAYQKALKRYRAVVDQCAPKIDFECSGDM